LVSSMSRALSAPGDVVAFRVERRDFFQGRWLKHIQMTAYYERLFRPEKMSYERLVHCVSKADGPVGVVDGYLDHFPFSKGIGEWVSRHNSYSSKEAQQTLLDRGMEQPARFRDLFLADNAADRRKKLKSLYYRMPARPIIKFFFMYVVKRGFLDGRPGFIYAVLIAFYEYLIVLKTRELEAQRQADRSSILVRSTEDR
jgi:hypothetical protein